MHFIGQENLTAYFTAIISGKIIHNFPALWLFGGSLAASMRKKRFETTSPGELPANPYRQLYVLGSHFCPIQLPLRGFTSRCRRLIVGY